MTKTKRIEKEIEQTEKKNISILNETDINESDKEAETISTMKIKIFNKIYKITDLIKLTEKKNKSYDEIEITKKFKLLMKNYYDGIEYAILRNCCGKKYTLQDLKNKLKEKDAYNIIDIRCSRSNLQFDKNAVNTIIEFVEKNNLKK